MQPYITQMHINSAASSTLSDEEALRQSKSISSKTLSIAKGMLSGAASGALMMGILFGLSFIPGLAFLAPGLLHGGAMVLATGMFGGVIAAKNAIFISPESYTAGRSTVIPVPIAGLTAPMVSQSLENAPEQAPTKSWVAQTGREGDSQSRVQQILANGALSDKDRASAILAAREAASTQDNQRLM